MYRSTETPMYIYSGMSAACQQHVSSMSAACQQHVIGMSAACQRVSIWARRPKSMHGGWTIGALLNVLDGDQHDPETIWSFQVENDS